MSIGPEAGRRHGRVTGWVGAPCDKGGLGLLSDPMGRNKVKPEQALYGAFFVKEFTRAANLCPSSVSLFDLKARFFVPTRTSLAPSRAEAVKVGRRTNLATGSACYQATP